MPIPAAARALILSAPTSARPIWLAYRHLADPKLRAIVDRYVVVADAAKAAHVCGIRARSETARTGAADLERELSAELMTLRDQLLADGFGALPCGHRAEDLLRGQCTACEGDDWAHLPAPVAEVPAAHAGWARVG